MGKEIFEMGLDQYMYAAARAGQYNDFWESGEYDKETKEFINKTVTKPIEIGYRRKHPNLHGWFYNLWVSKGRPMREEDDEAFNGVELELTWEDIDQLEHDLNVGTVKDIAATGFFWGDPSDEYYREDDLAFIKEARAQLFLGLRVFYNSSW